MTDVELLLLKLKIMKMNHEQLEKLVDVMTDRTGDPALSLDYMDRLERQATIRNTQTMFSRSSSSSSNGATSKNKSAKLDLSAYYRALDADEAEAEERAERDEVRSLAQRRLDTLNYCESVGYRKPAKSPLETYIAELDSQSNC